MGFHSLNYTVGGVKCYSHPHKLVQGTGIDEEYPQLTDWRMALGIMKHIHPKDWRRALGLKKHMHPIDWRSALRGCFTIRGESEKVHKMVCQFKSGGHSFGFIDHFYLREFCEAYNTFYLK